VVIVRFELDTRDAIAEHIFCVGSEHVVIAVAIIIFARLAFITACRVVIVDLRVQIAPVIRARDRTRILLAQVVCITSVVRTCRTAACGLVSVIARGFLTITITRVWPFHRTCDASRNVVNSVLIALVARVAFASRTWLATRVMVCRSWVLITRLTRAIQLTDDLILFEHVIPRAFEPYACRTLTTTYGEINRSIAGGALTKGSSLCQALPSLLVYVRADIVVFKPFGAICSPVATRIVVHVLLAALADTQDRLLIDLRQVVAAIVVRTGLSRQATCASVACLANI
jgi:hypothetical protein